MNTVRVVPVGLLPPWVRPLSTVWPPTWGAEALRVSALGGAEARRRATLDTA